jgi:hypothetical protein
LLRKISNKNIRIAANGQRLRKRNVPDFLFASRFSAIWLGDHIGDSVGVARVPLSLDRVHGAS